MKTVNGRDINTEYWVMRVLLHQGPQGATPVQLDMMTPGAQLATRACIATGTLVMLSDGCICEPTEVFEFEADARTHRQALLDKFPGNDFRIVMNADVDV